MIEECLVVEFRVTGDGCPLADASRASGTAIDSRPPQLRRDGNALLRFGAASDDPGAVLDADDRIRYLHASAAEDRYDYRCLSKQPCVVHELTDAGFLVDSIAYRDGVERHVGAVVGYDVLRGVLDAADETVGVTLERVAGLAAGDDMPAAQQWDLTPAQEAALRTALGMGYFSVPRGTTAGEVADELGISKSAFLERLRRGLSTLLSQVF